MFDPYSGVGLTLIAGLKHGRRVVGSEKESEYVQITRDRIAAFSAGKLPMRPLGKPVYEPTGHDKISQIPDEWRDLG